VWEYVARIANIAYASFGLLAVFSLVNYLIEKCAFSIPDKAVKLSGYCFGVYVFHQFLILLVVENPYMINLCGTYALPWVAFAVALAGSMILTGFMLKTKIGRFLIG
jgi:surface polysaccharide O-acyltransferase-like enzyme